MAQSNSLIIGVSPFQGLDMIGFNIILSEINNEGQLTHLRFFFRKYLNGGGGEV